MRRYPLVLFYSSVFAAACGTVPEPGPLSAGRSSPHARRIAYAADFAGRGTVMAVLQNRNPGMVVQRTDGCPRITLRGQNSINGNNNPVVYVDGNRTSDTCILEQLNPNDVARIEVYPGGIAPRGRPASSPGGLILVFLRQPGS